MLQFLVLAILLMLFLSAVVAVIFAVVSGLALAAIVGIPLWLIFRPKLQYHGFIGNRQNALDRLKTLYVEGKIDLFEFERRAARLISIE